MQFVQKGPDVPELLLQAHEEGRVVFFCGAGISCPADLPIFSGLVAKIYAAINVPKSHVEQTAIDSFQYDTAIALLEGRVTGQRATVRDALASVLVPDFTRPKATQTHEALLTLSKSRKGQYKLITTNFDRIFEEVIARDCLTVPRFQAPLLPVPKRRWDGLVYLHGLIGSSPTHAELDKLVVSSGDFGLAYLTERWAARFVSELFRNYTVCFVGYGINDPVMRYMMDALAADRQLGESPIEVFAFGNFEPGQETKAANEWAAKNVTPILYATSVDHGPLHETLHAWAATYRDGIRGKESIIARHASAIPTGSTIQDNFVGRIVWALSDTSGLPAKHFADLDPPPPFEWLSAFAERRFFHRDLVRFGIKGNDVVDDDLNYSLINRPAPYTHAPWMSLVQQSPGMHSRWDNVMPHIARWLARHIGNPSLALWVAARGGHIDHRLKSFVVDQLAIAPLPEPMASLWRIVIAGRLQNAARRFDLFDWGSELSRTGLTPLLRMELRSILSPRVRLREGYKWMADNEPESETEKFNSAIDWEIVFDAEHPHSAIQTIEQGEHWRNALPVFLDQFTDLLHEALDLMKELGRATARSDRSHWHQPSISRHPQNQRFRDWTVLIELLRDSWLAAVECNPAAARREVKRWESISYPLFRRFVLFAAAEKPHLFTAEQALALLLADKGWWLWSSETQREVIQLFAVAGPLLNENQLAELQAAILAGLPAEIFDAATNPETVVRIQDRGTWLRLTTLREAGLELNIAAQETLQTLLMANPQWGVPDERDAFPVWSGTDGNWSAFNKTPHLRQDLETWLIENAVVDDLHEEDDFQERCRTDMARALSALIGLAAKDNWPTDRWKQALQAWSNEEHSHRAWRRLRTLLLRFPPNAFDALTYHIGYLLMSVAKRINTDEEEFFELVRKVLKASRGELKGSDIDPLTAAINHPVGHVTQAILTWWYAQKLEDNQGLQEPVRGIFTDICAADEVAFRHGRVTLCTHVITLYRVDQDWTKKHLLPLFEWDRFEEAISAWTGFLSSPRLYWPLMAAIKAPFLQAVAHYEDLERLGGQLVGLLTFAALEREESFTNDEFATATARLPPDGLAQAARILADGLQSVGDRRLEYWNNRVKPYLHAIWPKTKDARTLAVSTQIAELIVAAGDAFPDALQMLQSWIMRSDDTSSTLHSLHESGICTKFSEQALDLIDRLVPDNSRWNSNILKTNIVVIRNANQALAQDHRFLRLETIVRQHNISI
jgi:hypothetical protein